MLRGRHVTKRTKVAASAIALTVIAGLVPAFSPASAAPLPSGYRLNDYADGQAMSILPPGTNGLVNATDLALFELNGTRPKNSQSQLSQYANLLYGYQSLTDGSLATYFNDESFGVKPADVIKIEKPKPGVVIYRDKLGIPHIYGDTDALAAYGAGFAQAEDRLFLMDVLRNYGKGTLAQFLGGSCAFEQMDHDQLLLAPYTPAQATAQVNNLPTEFPGGQGQLAKDMINGYVQGVNGYISKMSYTPSLLPADYVAAAAVPSGWTVADVVYIAGLIGGIFGRGGGTEVANSALLKHLQTTLGAVDGSTAFNQLKAQNDPNAPTTATTSFPYETPGVIDPSLTALPDSTTLHGGPVNTDPNCNLAKPNVAALGIIQALQQLPNVMSNALVVNANHSVDGHPIAVFGPQVSYFAPQILSQLDIHSPHYDASGASFPGTGLVELGRGVDYAWSATSAGTDLIDQRIEKVCNPLGGAPAAEGKYYLFNGHCTAMVKEVHRETAIPKPGGLGAPVSLGHEIYKTTHGVVQGWTTVGGQPVAVVNQRSTFNHDVDSVIGFLGFGQPALTHDVQSWMDSAAKIFYTFNWFYVDDTDTGYFVSGLDPVRPSGVDPNLPTWGTGVAEWQGFLTQNEHVHQTNSPNGYFVSWNNKPAPDFSAADDQYGYGSVFRSQMLVNQLNAQFALHGGLLTRSNVVQAMEGAASQDLDGLAVLPSLLQYLTGHSEPSGVNSMLATLLTWALTGANRKKANPADTQYQQAAAVAIMDELMPNLIHSIWDKLLGPGTSTSYPILPMSYSDTPNNEGAHNGSAYDGGYVGIMFTTLQQLLGNSPADSYGAPITNTWCGTGPANCGAAIDAALLKTYNDLVTANGSTNVAAWNSSTASKAAKQTMPLYDAIQFRTLGVVGQPAIDWQNRPTFQQVVEFPRHRAR